MNTEPTLAADCLIDSRAVCAGMKLRTATERRILWWLHALTEEPGAVERVCAQIVAEYPERLQTETMAKGHAPGGIFSEADAAKINDEIFEEAFLAAETARETAREMAMKSALDAEIDANKEAAWDAKYPADTWPELDRSVEFLRETCRAEADGLPALVLTLLRRGVVADPGFFQDLPGALAECCRREGAAAAADFHQTNIGRQVWETLDWCLTERCPVFIMGREGRGKSEAARAYVRAHRGGFRICTAPGNGTKADIIREMARALALPCRSANGSGMLPAQIADVLRRSGLGIVIDEAHFLLMRRGQGGRPEMLDWIDSALVDHGVPVALVATPQFLRDLGYLERTAGWNAGSFCAAFAGVGSRSPRLPTGRTCWPSRRGRCRA